MNSCRDEKEEREEKGLFKKWEGEFGKIHGFEEERGIKTGWKRDK